VVAAAGLHELHPRFVVVFGVAVGCRGAIAVAVEGGDRLGKSTLLEGFEPVGEQLGAFGLQVFVVVAGEQFARPVADFGRCDAVEGLGLGPGAIAGEFAFPVEGTQQFDLRLQPEVALRLDAWCGDNGFEGGDRVVVAPAFERCLPPLQLLPGRLFGERSFDQTGSRSSPVRRVGVRGGG